MATTAQIAEVLRKDISPVIRDQFFKGKILLEKIQKNTGIVDMGSEYYVTLSTQLHSGVVATGESKSLFTGGKLKRAQSKTVPKYTVGTFRITYETLRATRDNKFALVKELRSQAEMLKLTMQKDINRQYYGFGNGQIALANGAGTASTTVTVDTPGTDNLFEGQSIIIGGTSAVLISSVDSPTQITIAAARTWSDNAVITKADGDGTAADEMMGLQGIVDDGTNVSTLQNIARASNFWWKSTLDTTSEALSIADMRTAFQAAEKYGDVDLIITTPELANKYSDLLTNSLANLRTADIKTQELGGGYVGLEFAVGKPGLAVVVDYDCPTGQMYFLSTKMLSQGVSANMEWLDQGGEEGILQRVPGTKDYEAVLVYGGNLVALSCRAHAALRNKTA